MNAIRPSQIGYFKCVIPQICWFKNAGSHDLVCETEDANIDIQLPNNQRQHRTVNIQKNVLPYALCHLLCPVSAALASIFRLNLISTSFTGAAHGGAGTEGTKILASVAKIRCGPGRLST